MLASVNSGPASQAAARLGGGGSGRSTSGAGVAQAANNIGIEHKIANRADRALGRALQGFVEGSACIGVPRFEIVSLGLVLGRQAVGGVQILRAAGGLGADAHAVACLEALRLAGPALGVAGSEAAHGQAGAGQPHARVKQREH